MITKHTASETMQDYLDSVKSTVAEITDPEGQPVKIPDFDSLQQAAGKLDSTKHPESFVHMIQALLGRAGSVGFDAPGPDYTVSFPHDHALHPTMGGEWYFIACHLKVTDHNNNHGRLSVLLSMQKNRCVGNLAQEAAGWTDQEVTLASNVVTVTVDMGPGNRSIYRRNNNFQWPLKGGIVNFSLPGQDFSFQCGPDSLRGSAHVLPLKVKVNDDGIMNIDLTLTNNKSVNTETAFFLQGAPIPFGNGGNGKTPIPTPGIYYSWPQLLVSGTITIQGNNRHTVDSGTGWIDHQLMMTSLKNPVTKSDPKGIYPIPFVDDPHPYNAWVWQFYNLDNGMAFTGAGFIQGNMIVNPPMAYGYFLTPDNKGGWTAIFINGAIDLLYPNAFPSLCGDIKNSTEVVIPIVRAYTGIENILFGQPLSGVVTPWYSDGTFNNPDGSLFAEFPSDYTDMSGKYANGVGYMESEGFQSVEAYRKFALHFLQNN